MLSFIINTCFSNCYQFKFNFIRKFIHFILPFSTSSVPYLLSSNTTKSSSQTILFKTIIQIIATFQRTSFWYGIEMSCWGPGPGGIPLGFNQLLNEKVTQELACLEMVHVTKAELEWEFSWWIQFSPHSIVVWIWWDLHRWLLDLT